MRVLLNGVCKNLQNTACATLFDYVYYSNKYGIPHFGNACSCNLSLFDLITEVTEVSVFILVEENLIEPVKGGNENQY